MLGWLWLILRHRSEPSRIHFPTLPSTPWALKSIVDWRGLKLLWRLRGLWCRLRGWLWLQLWLWLLTSLRLLTGNLVLDIILNENIVWSSRLTEPKIPRKLRWNPSTCRVARNTHRHATK